MLSNLVGKYKNTKHLLASAKETLKAGYPARKLKVIGITGTDGKTTTCHLIYHILKSSGKKVALLSTVAAYIGDEVIDTGSHTTTPDAKLLQPLIKRVADSGMEYLVLEVTSHGLDQHRVLGANFMIGVLTNVTSEHLDYHKTFENYRKAKAKLFKSVKYAVLNKDDKSFKCFKDVLKPTTKLVPYSIKQQAALSAKNVHITPSGMEFTVVENGKARKVKTVLLGKYNVSNILAAVGSARLLGVKWPEIISTLETFKGVDGRMEVILPRSRRRQSNKEFTTIVDFAHTPNSLESVLKTLRQIKGKGGKIIAVFGCASERDVQKRPIMGEISSRLADISIFTSEDPRNEDPMKIIDEISRGVKLDHLRGVQIYKEPDRRKAIKLAISKASKGDIVVVCGKGHEKSMNIAGKELPWSDQEEVRKALLYEDI